MVLSFYYNGFVPSLHSSIIVVYRHKKTTAQVLVRWCLDHGFVVIPKSVKEQRIIENTSVFDFQLSPEDLQSMVCFIDFTELFRVVDQAFPIS